MTVIDACRACGSGRLRGVLDLGTVPLANALLREEDLGRPEPRFPLTLLFCEDCAMAQLRETVDPEVLFRDYVYFSSFSDTMLRHAREEADEIASAERLGPGSLVVEIASNDGYLLRNFVERGIPVLGIEPARNVAAVATERGVPTLCEFFSRDLAARLAAEGRRADVVLANNVLAHVPDIRGMAEGMAALLADHGLGAVEFPYVGDMLAALEFDTIYHEHVFYFSLHALSGVLERHGLRVVDVRRFPIHGGSLRVSFRRAGPGAVPAPSVAALLAEERSKGLDRPEFYADFAARVEGLGNDLRAELRRRKTAAESLAAYGASAKGSTLMNAFGIGADLIDFVADRSTVKQGRYTPGNRLPILPPEALLARRPDAVLLLTWNFADEIFRQQAEYLRRGGTFIVPVPRVRTVGQEVLT